MRHNTKVLYSLPETAYAESNFPPSSSPTVLSLQLTLPTSPSAIMSTDADAWSKTANAYAGLITDATGKAGDALLDLVEALRPLSGDSIVLDSGAGTGELTTRILKRSPRASVTATDVAPGMLQILNNRQLPIKTQILDATKDYVSQGLQPEHFTHVLSTFMHQFITPVQKSVEESFRILQSGGILGIAIWSKNDVFKPWDIACLSLDPSYKPMEPGLGLFEWREPDQMEIAYYAAGFTEVSSDKMQLRLEWASAEEFADYFLTAKNPGFLLAQSTWKGSLEEVRGELVKVTREQFDDGKIFVEAAFTVGRKP